jgi:hypothetical protein
VEAVEKAAMEEAEEAVAEEAVAAAAVAAAEGCLRTTIPTIRAAAPLARHLAP